MTTKKPAPKTSTKPRHVPDAGPWRCLECPLTFADSDDAVAHMEVDHGQNPVSVGNDNGVVVAEVVPTNAVVDEPRTQPTRPEILEVLKECALQVRDGGPAGKLTALIARLED